MILIYRKKSLQYHPDRNPDDPEAEAMFMMVTKAFECLKDEKSRLNCEKTGDPEGKGSGSFSVSMFPLIKCDKCREDAQNVLWYYGKAWPFFCIFSQ